MMQQQQQQLRSLRCCAGPRMLHRMASSRRRAVVAYAVDPNEAFNAAGGIVSTAVSVISAAGIKQASKEAVKAAYTKAGKAFNIGQGGKGDKDGKPFPIVCYQGSALRTWATEESSVVRQQADYEALKSVILNKVGVTNEEARLASVCVVLSSNGFPELELDEKKNLKHVIEMTEEGRVIAWVVRVQVVIDV